MLSARSLPSSRLGDYIERYVNTYLKSEGLNNIKVLVRVMSSFHADLIVKPAMKRRYVDTGSFSPNFPHTKKSIYVFLEHDEDDLCFFAIYCQEYGSNCPYPNKGSVYLAYLDSVQFFKPSQYRSEVYHRICLGYMDYVRSLGYTNAHIWSCPPKKGDDYIFQGKPSTQKMPSQIRLITWYEDMLNKGKQFGIIQDFKHIYDLAVEGGFSNVTDLPYFDGDHWSIHLEDWIKETEKAENTKELQSKKQRVDEALADSPLLSNPLPKRKRGRPKNKPKKATVTVDPRLNPKLISDEVGMKLCGEMKTQNRAFFIVKLNTTNSPSIQNIVDPDKEQYCEVIEGRAKILEFCDLNGYNFRTLENAKKATEAILRRAHSQINTFECNFCKKLIISKYKCSVCEEFDLCPKCFAEKGHNHKMRKTGFDLEACLAFELAKDKKDWENFRIMNDILVEVASLPPGRNLRKDPDRYVFMKRILEHVRSLDFQFRVDRKRPKVYKGCNRDECADCRLFSVICNYHARRCLNSSCPVPLCYDIKMEYQQNRKSSVLDCAV